MLDQILVPLQSGGSSTPGGGQWQIFLILGAMIALFYFLMIRPQKKKERKEAEMRKTIQVGDEVITAGGIVGIVFSIKEDTMVIETGGDRSKIRVKRWAIYSNETVHENDQK